MVIGLFFMKAFILKETSLVNENNLSPGFSKESSDLVHYKEPHLFRVCYRYAEGGLKSGHLIREFYRIPKIWVDHCLPFLRSSIEYPKFGWALVYLFKRCSCIHLFKVDCHTVIHFMTEHLLKVFSHTNTYKGVFMTTIGPKLKMSIGRTEQIEEKYQFLK